MFHEVSKGLEAYPRTWPFFGSFKKINKAFFYHFFKTGNLDPNSTKCLGLKLYPKHCILHSGCSLSCSAGCWRTDTSRDSTDCDRPDPSRCSTGCCRQDMSRDSAQSFVNMYRGNNTGCSGIDTSRGSTVCCRTEKSRGSTDCCRPDTSRCSLGCCGLDMSMNSTFCCRTDMSRAA